MKIGDTYYRLKPDGAIVAVRIHAIFPHLASCDVVMPDRSIEQHWTRDLFPTKQTAEEAASNAD